MKTKIIAALFALCLLAGCAGEEKGPTQPVQSSQPTQNGDVSVCDHSWQEATCTSARICSLCKATDGKPLGHSYGAWQSNGDGTHIRHCQHDSTHAESAACFDNNDVTEGATCPNCGYVYESQHTHVYNQQLENANYKVSDATCKQGAGYLYSCKCGQAGTEVFYGSQTTAHTEVLDEGKHATFSMDGLTEGSHCSVCGTVIRAQTVIPALGSDMVVGTDYYDRDGQTTYRYSYSFTIYENNRFNLTTLKVGSDETYRLFGEEGRLNFLDHGIYELFFDSGREPMYGKIVNGKFEFCDRNGGRWNGQQSRPHGATTIAITPRPGNSVYGYNDLANNSHGTSMQELYYRLYAAAEAFTNNRDTVQPVGGKYIVDRIDLNYYVLTANEAVAVWKVFYMENPRYYWLSNSVSLSGGTLEVCIDPAYAQGSYRAQCDAAIESMATECASQLSSDMNEMKKALVIHDYIVGRMNYAYKSDGVTPQDAIWAHNMIGCAEKKSGVCESYAKTYQYLCRLNGLDCIVAVGFNGANHAWNVTKIGDQWYGVDCTFDETNTNEISYNCFGMPNDRMNSEYTVDKPDGNGIQYLYQMPQLAQRGMELVNLYKAEVLVDTYASIDEAFAAMTDTAGEYEVELYCYGLRGPLLISSATVEHHITSTETPNVKRLTIRGKNIDPNSGFYFRPSIYIDSDLRFCSDMTLYDINLVGEGTLNIRNNKVLCKGTCVQFCIPVSGSMDGNDPSEIESAVIQDFHSIFSMKIHTFRSTSETDQVRLMRNVHFIEAYVDAIEFEGAAGETYQAQIDCLYGENSVDVRTTNRANISIGRIVCANGTACIHMELERAEDLSAVSIGSVDAMNVQMYIDGRSIIEITDMNGNVVNQYEIMFDVSQVTAPVLKLNDSSVYDRLRIFYFDIEGNSHDKTSDYMLNDQNQVIIKAQ